MPRSRKVFKKRKGTFFKGRNITSSSNSTLDADVSNNDIKTDIKNPCAKERKIPDLNASFSTFEGNIGVINAIMNLNILSFVFKNDVRCKKCDNGMDMQILKNNSGLAISFVLKCCVCPYRVEFSSSDYHEGTQRATVNTRYVYAMRSIGRGAEAGRMFCALMNLPQPPTRFAPYNKRLLNAVKLVSEETMQKATQEAVLENGSNNNIAVAVDGTWQKRVLIIPEHCEESIDSLHNHFSDPVKYLLKRKSSYASQEGPLSHSEYNCDLNFLRAIGSDIASQFHPIKRKEMNPRVTKIVKFKESKLWYDSHYGKRLDANFMAL
ncbi:uncharacterized protein NPIL_164961 [Nephila pilipes]|uniref:Mutator-like transposase domain-containing protein n=1 Tax=Nephila pilipes TaxID=299642 RepID=A0A8X6TXQ3_NEPPI|nr:uncharacterized protein NPIL_164961 [Nephila pilipes]